MVKGIVIAFIVILMLVFPVTACAGQENSRAAEPQTEAAYTLGFNKTKTFFKVVMPQALEFILPIYKGELVSLIKATAIVGYIAVEDLTRVGDIVRSRTYEAFFPLIAVAVIYFLLARLLILIANMIEKRIDPKRRKAENILKGVNTHD